MSVDWLLFSPSRKRCVMIGSIGLGGVQPWPTEYGGKEFLAWAIEENVTDVQLVTENDPRLADIDVQDDTNWGPIEPPPF